MTETTGRSTALAMDSVPIDSLIPHPKNARQGDLGAVIESVRENGCYRPLICQRSTRYILAGNHLWRALQSEGYQQVNVVWIDCDPERALRILLVDNRANDLASYDNNALAELLQSLPSLEGTGFDSDALDELLADLGQGGTAGLTPEDEVPPVPVAPVSVLGDLWLLGEHRVLCGDSTSIDAVSGLMGGKEAALLWTDPPYGVKYSGRGGSTSQQTIENDDLDPQELQSFLTDALSIARCAPGCNAFVCHADSKPGIRPAFEAAFQASGFILGATIIWVKQAASMGWQDFRSQHEPILFGWRSGGSRVRVEDRALTTVWNVSRDGSLTYKHPTQKPVALPEIAIQNTSSAKALVLDPFLGSGSTLIACEKTGRICYGMELSPAYCDVIVKRWQEFTGKEATLDGDGRTFAAIEAMRRGDSASRKPVEIGASRYRGAAVGTARLVAGAAAD